MLSSVLNTKKAEFLDYINEIWSKECGVVRYEDFNKPISTTVSTVKFISLLSEKMYNERLAVQINEEGIIVGWQFFVKPEEK